MNILAQSAPFLLGKARSKSVLSSPGFSNTNFSNVRYFQKKNYKGPSKHFNQSPGVSAIFNVNLSSPTASPAKMSQSHIVEPSRRSQTPDRNIQNQTPTQNEQNLANKTEKFSKTQSPYQTHYQTEFQYFYPNRKQPIKPPQQHADYQQTPPRYKSPDREEEAQDTNYDFKIKKVTGRKSPWRKEDDCTSEYNFIEHREPIQDMGQRRTSYQNLYRHPSNPRRDSEDGDNQSLYRTRFEEWKHQQDQQSLPFNRKDSEFSKIMRDRDAYCAKCVNQSVTIRKAKEEEKLRIKQNYLDKIRNYPPTKEASLNIVLIH